MKLLTTRLHAPVLRQRLSAEIHSQGKPTAFEKMAVSLVKTGRMTEGLKGQSIPALFELLIGSDAANLFLDETINRLFSPTIAILGVGSDVHFSSYRDLPVAEIEVLPNGEELLRTGLFPTQARLVHRTVLFDPLSSTIKEEADSEVDSLPENPDRTLPESLATATWPEEEAEAFVKETLLRPGDTLSGISREGEGTVDWTTFTANLELEDGTLKATSLRCGAADYLNGLSPDDFRRLMLAGLGFIKAAGPVRNLDNVASSDLFPASAPEPVPESWIWFHPDVETSPKAPKGVRLEVVWSTGDQTVTDGQPFSVGSNGAPDRLVLAAGPYPDAMASGDLRTFSHVVMARAFFARTPLEIPIGLREHLSEEAVAAMVDELVSALRDTGHSRAFAHADALRRFHSPRQNKHTSQSH
jgi:hypothetical protein